MTEQQAETWDELVQSGVSLAQVYMQWHITTGALANRACPDRQAGPTAERRTLGQLAWAIGIGRSELSRAGADVLFYTPEMLDDLPAQANPRLLHAARGGSGWKRGDGDPTEAQRADAMAYIVSQIEDPEPRARNVPGVYELIQKAQSSLIRAMDRPAEFVDPEDRQAVVRAVAVLNEVD